MKHSRSPFHDSFRTLSDLSSLIEGVPSCHHLIQALRNHLILASSIHEPGGTIVSLTHLHKHTHSLSLSLSLSLSFSQLHHRITNRKPHKHHQHQPQQQAHQRTHRMRLLAPCLEVTKPPPPLPPPHLPSTPPSILRHPNACEYLHSNHLTLP